MKAKFITLLLMLLTASQALACSVCSVTPQSKSAQSMASAIWFLMGSTMLVLGCVGAFSFHLWRHGRMPLEPHQELTEEDLKQYD